MKGIGLIIGLILTSQMSWGRDLDGRYAQGNPDLHEWFNSLTSKGKMACCSNSDGSTVDDPDWGRQDKVGFPYWVRLDDVKWDVPEDAVVQVPNLLNHAIVWPIVYATKVTGIRCFMAGPEV